MRGGPGPQSSVRVPAPRVEFTTLAHEGLDLDAVKRRYIEAVYFWTGDVKRAAKILKVDRSTVYRYLGVMP